MIDTGTRKPLKVRNEGNYGPYLMLPYTQLDEVRRILDENRISYWVEDEVIAIDDGPEIAYVEFPRSESEARIQALLDSVN